MTACPDDGWSFTVESDATYHPPTPIRSTQARGVGAVAAAASVAPAIEEEALPPPSDLMPGFQVGEYKIEKKIGEGGMGAVYGAVHPLIGKRAAIKVISAALGADSSAVNRFVQEAKSVNQIGHPNIVDIFAFGELPDGRNYFVMEYLQGESLADRIQRVEMPLGEAIEILDQVADALEAAHEKQIVHRDLKPDNVYLAAVRGGRTMVKLLDFGIAKLSVVDGGTGSGVAKTRTGMMMGTPGYLSPEQARGKNVDHRTDIYALGCMTFEIVCGRLPFVADNAMDIVLMHMTAPPPRASEIWPEIPAPLDELIARMLEKDAAARPTLAEIRATFADLVTSGLVTLNNPRGVAFGSGIGRLATPGGGTPVHKTAQPGLAIGTNPAQSSYSSSPGTAAPALATTPPVTVAKKKTGLLIGIGAAVLLLGGGGAFVAMQGGGGAKQAPVVAPAPAPTVAPTPPPAPAAAPVEAKPEPAKVAEAPKPGAVEIKLNVDKAEATLDGTAMTVSGKVAKAAEVPEGEHEVVVNAPGRAEQTAKVTVKAGETAQLVVKLDRAKAGSSSTKKAATGEKTEKKAQPAAGSNTQPAKQPDKKIEDKNYTVDPFSQ